MALWGIAMKPCRLLPKLDGHFSANLWFHPKKEKLNTFIWICLFDAWKSSQNIIKKWWFPWLFTMVQSVNNHQNKPNPCLADDIFPSPQNQLEEACGSNGLHLLLTAEILHQLISSLSLYLWVLYIPGGARFLPSTV